MKKTSNSIAIFQANGQIVIGMSQAQRPPEKFFWRKESASTKDQQVQIPKETEEVEGAEEKRRNERIDDNNNNYDDVSGITSSSNNNDNVREEKEEASIAPKQAAAAVEASPHTLAQPLAVPSAVKTKIVIGIPCHNQEGIIGMTIIKLGSLGGDIVVCDDGSTDMSEEIARRMGCKIVKHPRQLGHSDSITSLFLAARRLQADMLLTIRPDSQFKLGEITQLMDSVQSGDCDIAISVPFHEEINAAAIIAGPGAGSSGGANQTPSTSLDTGFNDSDESSFEVYGKKALTLIAPPGTQSVVVENEILEFAEQQGLKVREFQSSTKIDTPAISAEAATKSMSKNRKKKGSSSSSSIYRMMSFATFNHPLLFFGLPSVGFFAAAAFQAVYTISVIFSQKYIPQFGVLLASSLLLVAVVLAVGSSVLESQKIGRSLSRPNRAIR